MADQYADQAVIDSVGLFADRLQHGGEHEPGWAKLLRFELAAQADLIAALETRIAALEGAAVEVERDAGAMGELANPGTTSAMEIDQRQKDVCPPGDAGQSGQKEHIPVGHGDHR
jgi:hypothetical protein